MLRPKPNKDASSSGFSTPEERLPEQQHERNTSLESIKSIHDVKAAERVGELERSLAIAREEHHAMREELEKVKQHGKVYRETIEDYRRQLSGTYTHSPRPSSPPATATMIDYEEDVPRRRSSTKHHEDLIDENYDLRRKVADLQNQLVEQHSLFSARLDQSVSRRDSEWNDLAGRLHHSEKESQERLQQLLDLKHSISALTRMENQVTDSELAERIDQLHYRIREWVISHFRRAKLNFSTVSKDTARALQGICLDPESITSVDRLPFYQAVIASALMHVFREPICLGLPETGPLAPIRQLAAYIHDSGSSYREWRRSTIRALENSEARHALHEGKEQQLHRIAGEIEHQLFSLTSTNLTPHSQTSLVAILRDAAEVQHMLLLQKAHYQIVFFRSGLGKESHVSFDAERMEAVNDVDDMDEDGDTNTERKFMFCVFPCLEKYGDEFGEGVDVRNVLLKAKVCCGDG